MSNAPGSGRARLVVPAVMLVAAALVALSLFDNGAPGVIEAVDGGGHAGHGTGRDDPWLTIPILLASVALVGVLGSFLVGRFRDTWLTPTPNPISTRSHP